MNYLCRFVVFVGLVGAGLSSAEAQAPRFPAAGKTGLTLASSFTTSGESDLKYKDTLYRGVKINQYEFSARQSIRSKTAGGFVFSADYDHTDLTLSDAVVLPEELQSLRFSLGHSTRVSERWMLNSSVGVSSNVADGELLADGWGAQVRVFGAYRWTPAFTLTTGLVYNSLSEDWKFIPVLGFDWKFAEKWTASLGFPRAGVMYAFRPNLRFSAGLLGSGGTFCLDDKNRQTPTGASLAGAKLQYTDFRVGLRTEWEVSRAFALHGSVGRVVYRDFKYIDRGYRLRGDNHPVFLSVGASVAF